MKEKEFQAELIKDLKQQFKGCVILKNDSKYIQGIPDLTILYKNKWAMLECKESADYIFRPNQKHYIDVLDKMGFARVVYPENKKEVINELQRTFASKR